VEIKRKGAGRFAIGGELDISNADEAREIMEAELEGGSALVIDLSGLTFMDSQGLRLFLQLVKRAQQIGLSPVVLMDPTDEVRRVLEIALPHGAPGLEIREAEGG
jgi:anti-anti-sigma factor